MNNRFDVIVVGGGINGVGIARDAQMRGLRVLLLEKRDLCTGATGGCSGMIHGGLRYMINDVPTTKKSCLDSGHIQKIAPHMLFRIPFIYPITDRTPAARLALELFETYFEAYDLFQPLKNGKPHTRLTPAQIRALEPALAGRLIGGVTMDEYGIDPFRLVVANAVAAKEAGAVIKTYTEVIDFLKSGSSVIGVLARDTRTGEETEYYAPVTFNATGPWLMQLCERAGVKSVRIRPSKGVHLVLDRRFSNVGILTPAIDGRSIFIIPHENVSLIGTTDDDYFGDPDHIPITQDEVEYLLTGIAHILPDVRKARIVRAFAALRPTLYAYGKLEDDLSRDHRIYDHTELDGVGGLLSIGGGKLAAYRIMCEEAVDKIFEKLGRQPVATRTHIVALPGGNEAVDVPAIAKEYRISLFAAERLVFKQGARARAVLDRTEIEPTTKEIICACEAVTRAEIEYVIEHEWVKTPSDLCRRTRLGMGPCQGCNCAVSAAEIVSDKLGYEIAQRKAAVKEFYTERFKGRRPVESGDSLVQEELAYALHVGVANFDGLIG